MGRRRCGASSGGSSSGARRRTGCSVVASRLRPTMRTCSMADLLVSWVHHQPSTPGADRSAAAILRATEGCGRGATGMRFEVRTTAREQMVDITEHVRGAVSRAGIGSGRALVFCPHTTAGVTINEAADPDVATDILAGLTRLVPSDGPWRHAEGNADAHIKATIVGSSVEVPVAEGRLVLGTWQGVFFCEFDGPRTRSVSVTVHAG